MGAVLVTTSGRLLREPDEGSAAELGRDNSNHRGRQCPVGGPARDGGGPGRGRGHPLRLAPSPPGRGHDRLPRRATAAAPMRRPLVGTRRNRCPKRDVPATPTSNGDRQGPNRAPVRMGPLLRLPVSQGEYTTAVCAIICMCMQIDGCVDWIRTRSMWSWQSRSSRCWLTRPGSG